MLIKFLFFLVFCVGVMQISNCRPQEATNEKSEVQEAIAQINPKLDEIKQRLKQLKVEIYMSILKTETATHNAIANLGTSIIDVISDLETKTTDTEKDIIKNNVNITKCVVTQHGKLETLLIVANKLIRNNSAELRYEVSRFTEKFDGIIKEADSIENSMNKIIGYCIRQQGLPWKSKLMDCFTNETNYLKNTVLNKFYQQKQAIDMERFVFVNNLTMHQRKFVNSMSSIKTEFFKCVSEFRPLNDEKLQPPQIDDLAESKNITLEIQNLSGLNALETSDAETHDLPVSARIKKIQELFGQLKELRQVHDGDDRKLTENETSKNNKSFLLYMSF